MTEPYYKVTRPAAEIEAIYLDGLHDPSIDYEQVQADMQELVVASEVEII